MLNDTSTPNLRRTSSTRLPCIGPILKLSPFDDISPQMQRKSEIFQRVLNTVLIMTVISGNLDRLDPRGDLTQPFFSESTVLFYVIWSDTFLA